MLANSTSINLPGEVSHSIMVAVPKRTAHCRVDTMQNTRIYYLIFNMWGDGYQPTSKYGIVLCVSQPNYEVEHSLKTITKYKAVQRFMKSNDHIVKI
jgi:hypothetical protein